MSYVLWTQSLEFGFIKSKLLKHAVASSVNKAVEALLSKPQINRIHVLSFSGANAGFQDFEVDMSHLGMYYLVGNCTSLALKWPRIEICCLFMARVITIFIRCLMTKLNLCSIITKRILRCIGSQNVFSLLYGLQAQLHLIESWRGVVENCNFVDSHVISCM
jgi:hypothetical protein